MYDCKKFFIDGVWVAATQRSTLDIVNPATEQVIGQVALGAAEDVDKAVKAARRAFESYSRTSPSERRVAARAHGRRLSEAPAGARQGHLG
jgi:aldehyde dehydrogenase (NAD+)